MEGQLSATLPAETAHDPWLAWHLAPVHVRGKVPIRVVVMPALWALCGLGQARTEPAWVPECFHPMPGIARGRCGAHPGKGSPNRQRPGCGRFDRRTHHQPYVSSTTLSKLEFS